MKYDMCMQDNPRDLGNWLAVSLHIFGLNFNIKAFFSRLILHKFISFVPFLYVSRGNHSKQIVDTFQLELPLRLFLPVPIGQRERQKETPPVSGNSRDSYQFFSAVFPLFLHIYTSHKSIQYIP